MDKNIQDLIEISRFYGNDPLYVNAGGGNTSYKNEEKLWVKASGSSLAIIEEDGFVCLDRQILKQIATKTYSSDSVTREEEVKNDLNSAILFPKDKRPSVETSLHEIIEFPFVIHTHPTMVNALMCAKDAKGLCDEIFGDSVLFIEYTDPGYILFKEVHEQIVAYSAKNNAMPKIIFLENHGVFVAGDTTQEVKDIYNDISVKLQARVTKELPATQQQDVDNQTVDAVKSVYPGAESMVIKGTTNELFKSFVSDSKMFEKVAIAYTPDNIVYCKAYYPFIEKQDSPEALKATLKQTIEQFKEANSYLPKVIAFEGEGIVIIEENEKSVDTIYAVFLDMLKVGFYAENFGGSKPMTEAQIAFIDNWEVENYRRKMAKS